MRRGTLLLVEDDADDLELSLLALRECHVANPVAVARDGVEALDYLFATGSHAGRPAEDAPVLTLLDLQLPRLDGLEVLRRIRGDGRTRHAPVIMLTSSTQERDVVASYDLGANGYVEKPVDFSQFVSAVRAVGLFWLVVNEPPPGRQ